MTARKPTPKATVTHTAAAERDALGSMFASIEELLGGEHSAQITMTRTLSALVVGLTAGGAFAFFGLQVINVMALAAMAYTGVAFLAFMVGFVGTALLLIGTFVVTGKVQEYILSGGIDRTYESTKSLATEKIAVMRGWFKTRGEKVVDHVQESAASTYETLRGVKAKEFGRA